tara:strand:+ start:168 stop:767 length:600 start_codon:yes stop_codon:yes gene_type:complete
MKVKIKKDGKSKNYNIVDSWSDVTLEKFMELNFDESTSKTKEAEDTLAILSDLPRNIIKQLSLKDVSNLFERLSKLQTEHNEVLRMTITIDGVDYGMHPDLSEITLGEYADIETFIKDGLQKNLPNIMAILFRPITEEKNGVYTIEAYDGNIKIRAEEMKKMNAEQVQNALVFFWNFARIFMRILPLCLMDQNTKKANK